MHCWPPNRTPECKDKRINTKHRTKCNTFVASCSAKPDPPWAEPATLRGLPLLHPLPLLLSLFLFLFSHHPTPHFPLDQVREHRPPPHPQHQQVSDSFIISPSCLASCCCGGHFGQVPSWIEQQDACRKADQQLGRQTILIGIIDSSVAQRKRACSVFLTSGCDQFSSFNWHLELQAGAQAVGHRSPR